MSEVRADPIDMLRTRTSEKWTRYPSDVLPLFVAEMDYPLAPAVADAMIERVRASDTGYVGTPAPLAGPFATFAESAWGWQVDEALVRTATDVSVGIVELLRAAIEPGDGVVITPPVYAPFFSFLPEAGASVVEVPLVDDGTEWTLDFDGLERAFAAGAKAFLLCNPQNPIGLVHSRSALERVAELAAEYRVTVVSDEVHGPLTHSDATFVPFLSVSPAAKEYAVAITAASKAWNLAGAKCAVLIGASDRAAELFGRLPVEVGPRTSILGFHASIAAFRDGRDWLDGALASIESNRRLLTALLEEHLPGVVYREPHATYLAWLDFRALGWGDDPSVKALADARVALVSGPSFGAEGKGFARLNFACSPEMLTAAIERLAAAR